MGLQQSKNPLQIQQQQSISKYNYYGGKLIHNQQTHTIYQQFTLQEKYLIKFIKLIKLRQRLSHHNFINVKKYWRKRDDKQFIACGIGEIITIFVQYDYWPQTLTHKLDICSQKNIHLSEKQIIHIFKSILSCLIYLKSMKSCHGDLKPANIMFDSDGNIKLLDSYFVNGGKTSYEIVMQNPSCMSFLSPEQLESLKNGQFDLIQNIYSHQAFSLGLTMYECMSLKNGMECYDLDKLKVKRHYFDDKQAFLIKIGYSKTLVRLVLDLVLRPASERLHFQQIYDILEQFF